MGATTLSGPISPGEGQDQPTTLPAIDMKPSCCSLVELSPQSQDLPARDFWVIRERKRGLSIHGT